MGGRAVGHDLQQFQAGHPVSQMIIGQDSVPTACPGHRCFGRRRGIDMDAPTAEQRFQRLEDAGFVLDAEDAQRRAQPRRGIRLAGRRAIIGDGHHDREGAAPRDRRADV
jgi:hypothetical protein